MEYLTLNFISPNFGAEKLESASYEDLVDVFEDRMRHWFLNPAERLIGMPHCQIAAVALLISYFEGIAIYLSGKDSKNRSFEFFANAFQRFSQLIIMTRTLPGLSHVLSMTKQDAASPMTACSEIECFLAMCRHYRCL
jgi:hypothetical protein